MWHNRSYIKFPFVNSNFIINFVLSHAMRLWNLCSNALVAKIANPDRYSLMKHRDYCQREFLIPIIIVIMSGFFKFPAFTIFAADSNQVLSPIINYNSISEELNQLAKIDSLNNYQTIFNNEIKSSDDDSDDDLSVVRVITLDGVEITGKNNRYSKKNNPAYELMKRIRKSKDAGDPRLLPEYSEDFYRKIVIGLNNRDASSFRGKDRFRFLDEYVDTAAHTGLPIILLSLRETAGIILHSINFLKDKTIIKANRSAGIDDEFNNENVTTILEDLFKNVDIYKDDIVIMGQRFVSPIGHLADNFYKYFLNDTVIFDGIEYAELLFAPRSAESFGFNGRFWVEANDSSCFIRKVEMRVPRYINLNYVDNIFISQEYIKDEYGKRHLSSDDMSLELTLMPGTDTFYARRISKFGMPEFKDSKSLHNFLIDANNHIVYENSNIQPWNKWNDFRMVPLSRAEGGMGSFMNKMRKYPVIYWGEKILKILVNGYVATGKNSKFDLGPINTLVSYNYLEGWRLRLGGLTTANLSPHWFARGYVAYGFHDKRIKYNAELEYSFLAKQYHSREFPVNSLRLHYLYDLDQIGQHYDYTNSDNIFLSLKRQRSFLALYKREAGISYQLELSNNFSFIGQFSHRIFQSTSHLPFVDGYNNMLNQYVQAGFRIELRYAPGEKFIQGRERRRPVNLDAPIIRLIHDIVPGGMLGSDFTLNKSEFSVAKRLWFSAFGYADFILKGGKIWSQVQYPALLWQNANLSFTIQPESYSLLSPMEFPIDYFGSIDVSYFGNGILFNHIPYFKKLKLREVITFKGLMGGLTSRNDPAYNNNLFKFPEGVATSRLSSKPYMEFGVGIDNILTCLRLDYVWRLTYRDAPNAQRGGLRVSLHFSF